MGVVLQLVRPGEALAQPERLLPTFRPTGLKLSELVQWFLGEYASPLRAATRSNYARCLKVAVTGNASRGVHALPDHPTPAEVTRWLSELKTGGYADTTINLMRTTLVHLYESGSQCTQSYGNPVASVPWRKTTPKRAPLKSVRETWEFIRASKLLDDRERAFVCVLRYAGIRKGEALGLEARHVDLKGGVLRIDQQRRKANSPRTTRELKSDAARRAVPLRPELKATLAALLKSQGGETHEIRCGLGGGKKKRTALLFPFGEYQLGKILAVLRGIDPDGFPRDDAWHVFRHTCAVELWHAGKSEAFIQEWLGHASLEKTATYLRSLGGRRIRAHEVAEIDADFAPPPRARRTTKKAKARRDCASADLQTELGLRSASEFEVAPSNHAAPAVPPIAEKEEPMSRQKKDANATTTTTGPALPSEPLRKLGAQTLEDHSSLSQQAVAGLFEGGGAGEGDSKLSAPVEKCGAIFDAHAGPCGNAATREARNAAKLKKPDAREVEKATIRNAKLRSIVTLADEIGEQARTLGSVDAERAEAILSLVGGLLDAAQNNEPVQKLGAVGLRVAGSSLLAAMDAERKAALVALENMRESRAALVEERDGWKLLAENRKEVIEGWNGERAEVRALLCPLPDQSLPERCAEIVGEYKRLKKSEREQREKKSAAAGEAVTQ